MVALNLLFYKLLFGRMKVVLSAQRYIIFKGVASTNKNGIPVFPEGILFIMFID